MGFFKRLFWQRTSQNGGLDPERDSLLDGHHQAAKCSGSNDGLSAWLLAFGIFTVNFIVLGQGRVAGILYISFMEVLHVNRKMASAPYSVQQATRMFFGPVVGLLGQKFGVSAIIVTGCVIASFSSAVCYFAEDIKWIIVMWGGLYGLGTAFISTLNLILIEQYFVKYRSSASGLAFSGTSIGAIFFPALLEMLIEKYGIQGTFLIMGSIIMNAIPIAIFLKERSKYRSETKSSKARTQNGPFYNKELPKGHLKYNTVSENVQILKSTFEDLLNRKVDLKKSTPFLDSCKVEVSDSFKSPMCILDSSKNLKESMERLPKNKGLDYTKKMKQNKSLVRKPNDKTVSTTIIDSMHSKTTNDNDQMAVKISNNCNILIEPKKLDPPKIFKGSSQQDLEKEVDYFQTIKEDTSIDEKSKYLDKMKSFKEFKKVIASNTDKNGDEIRDLIKYNTISFEHINFKLLHDNRDLVLDMLSNKIPIGDEEAVSSSYELTHYDLESSNIEFISSELQRIEYYFHQPHNEALLFLTKIKYKLSKFKELLNGNRDQFLEQKRRLDLEGQNLKCKDIHNIKIRKPDCTIEIFEYSCEIPVELYIPIKIEELNQRSCAYIVKYSDNTRASKILKQLKKLHQVFSGSYNPADSSKPNESKTRSEIVVSSNIDSKLTEKLPNTSHNSILIAFKLHTNPMFLLVCVSRGLTTLTFVPVVTSVVDFVVDQGLKQSDGKYAIVALSIGDLIGRLCTGWITDKGYLSLVHFMAVAFILQGVFTAILPLTRGIAMVLPALVVFATFQGSLFIKHPLILLKYLQEHEKYIGLGFINFFSGIIGIVVPFYIGYVRDYLGSYDTLYYVNGALSAFIGSLWIMEPFFTKFVSTVNK